MKNRIVGLLALLLITLNVVFAQQALNEFFSTFAEYGFATIIFFIAFAAGILIRSRLYEAGNSQKIMMGNILGAVTFISVLFGGFYLGSLPALGLVGTTTGSVIPNIGGIDPTFWLPVGVLLLIALPLLFYSEIFSTEEGLSMYRVGTGGIAIGLFLMILGSFVARPGGEILGAIGFLLLAAGFLLVLFEYLRTRPKRGDEPTPGGVPTKKSLRKRFKDWRDRRSKTKEIKSLERDAELAERQQKAEGRTQRLAQAQGVEAEPRPGQTVENLGEKGSKDSRLRRAAQFAWEKAGKSRVWLYFLLVDDEGPIKEDMLIELSGTRDDEKKYGPIYIRTGMAQVLHKGYAGPFTSIFPGKYKVTIKQESGKYRPIIGALKRGTKRKKEYEEYTEEFRITLSEARYSFHFVKKIDLTKYVADVTEIEEAPIRGLRRYKSPLIGLNPRKIRVNVPKHLQGHLVGAEGIYTLDQELDDLIDAYGKELKEIDKKGEYSDQYVDKLSKKVDAIEIKIRFILEDTSKGEGIGDIKLRRKLKEITIKDYFRIIHNFKQEKIDRSISRTKKQKSFKHLDIKLFRTFSEDVKKILFVVQRHYSKSKKEKISATPSKKTSVKKTDIVASLGTKAAVTKTNIFARPSKRTGKETTKAYINNLEKLGRELKKQISKETINSWNRDNDTRKKHRNLIYTTLDKIIYWIEKAEEEPTFMALKPPSKVKQSSMKAWTTQLKLAKESIKEDLRTLPAVDLTKINMNNMNRFVRHISYIMTLGRRQS